MKSLEFGCKRPAVLSEKFCIGVREPQCYPKSFVWVQETREVSRKVLLPQKKKTHGHGYHLDFELGDRGRD